MNYKITANHPVLKYFSETVSEKDAGLVVSWLISLSYEISEMFPTGGKISYVTSRGYRQQ